MAGSKFFLLLRAENTDKFSLKTGSFYTFYNVKVTGIINTGA